MEKTKTIRKNHSLIGRLSVFLAQSLSEDVIKSGNPENVIVLAKKHVKISIVAAIIIMPTVFFVNYYASIENEFLKEETIRVKQLNEQRLEKILEKGFLPDDFKPERPPIPIIQNIQIPLTIILFIIPIILFFYPKLLFKNQTRNRKSIVDEEIPFFSIYASVLQSVNVNLYSSFQKVIDRKIFPAMEKEALLLKRNVELFGRAPLEAIEELGKSHQSETFKNFLLGYSSIARSGGDLSKYLETSADDQFQKLKIKYESYVRNVGYAVEALITIFVIVPVMFVVGAFVLPEKAISQMVVATSTMVPLMTIVFALLLVNIQPKMYNVVGVSDNTALIFLPIAIILFLGLFLLGMELWLSLAIAAIIPSTILEIYTLKHKMQVSKIEKVLPSFLRDITEYKKIGIQDSTAIIKISQENTYNKSFDRLVKTLSASFQQGYSLNEVLTLIRLRSWFARVTFFTLAQITESGGGNAAILESVTTFVRNIQNVLKEMKSSIAIYDILGIMSPILLVATISIINEMVGNVSYSSDSLTSSFESGLELDNVQGLQELIQVSPIFLSTIKTFVISSSIAMGILLGKASDRTFKSTGRIVLLCVLALMAILISENISITELI